LPVPFVSTMRTVRSLFAGGQLTGALAFVVIGNMMAVAGLLAPEHSMTDDGYPLGRFLLALGALFFVMGLLWVVGALALLRWLDNKQARTEARRAYLRQHGLMLQARVTAVSTEGYMNFENEFWSDLTLEYDCPGHPTLHVTRHIALPGELLELARRGGPVPILVDTRAPRDYELAWFAAEAR
jgi:hypothetical protein